jgi:uncharacterized protein YodC (DUF2158 family)
MRPGEAAIAPERTAAVIDLSSSGVRLRYYTTKGQTMTFQPGDVVFLKSGGQSMTVAAVSGENVECIWLGEEGDLFRQAIPAVVLTSAEDVTDDEDGEEEEENGEDEEEDEEEMAKSA